MWIGCPGVGRRVKIAVETRLGVADVAGGNSGT